MTVQPANSAFSAHTQFSMDKSVISHPAFSSGAIPEINRAWRDEVRRLLNNVCALPPGWDGYGAPPVAFEVANFALKMLEQTCPEHVPAPNVVPGPDGDLQLEWHTENLDIELHVRKPYDVHAWRRQVNGDEENEGELTFDYTLVTRWLSDLSEAEVAARPAAA